MDTTYEESNTLSFITLSGVLHGALFIFVIFFAPNFIQQPKEREITLIEIVSNPSTGSSASPVSAPAAAPAPSVAIAAPALPAKAHKAAAVAKAPAHASHADTTRTKPAPAAKAVTATASPLDNLDADSVQVAAPALETAELEAPTTIEATPLEDSDIADELNAIDQQNQKQTRAELEQLQQQLARDNENLSAEHQKNIAALEEKNNQDSRALATMIAERNNRERAASKASQAIGQGRGETNSSTTQSPSGSSSNGVKTLSEMKQKPGNSKPQYDSDDRLHQRQGQVAFLAYVNRDGSIGQIKPITLSGHRTLDLKTLKAIKNWKFYPGQEGWVEIPFKWDLKGGPQEMVGGLRTKVSQN